MAQISYTKIQAQVFNFALTDLVLNKRDSFQPLWTVDSWAKFLIWMALNCGLSGGRESLEDFADALGPNLTRRMRKIFFERTYEDLGLYLIADPAEKNVLILPITGERAITKDEANKTLESVALIERVVLDRKRWQVLDAVIAIPWHASEIGC